MGVEKLSIIIGRYDFCTHKHIAAWLIHTAASAAAAAAAAAAATLYYDIILIIYFIMYLHFVYWCCPRWFHSPAGCTAHP
jgi:hypothetical protein